MRASRVFAVYMIGFLVGIIATIASYEGYHGAWTGLLGFATMVGAQTLDRMMSS